MPKRTDRGVIKLLYVSIMYVIYEWFWLWVPLIKNDGTNPGLSNKWFTATIPINYSWSTGLAKSEDNLNLSTYGLVDWAADKADDPVFEIVFCTIHKAY
jgi:hypothetical protein